MQQKYKILRVKKTELNPLKVEDMIEVYFKQFVKKVDSIDLYTYFYFKKSVSDKRLIKIYNMIKR